MTIRSPAPQLAALSGDDARRVRLTISCRDADDLPKVEGAGEVFDHEGQPVQMMHNGVLVEEGCYYGPWMTEIIRSLRGHHEPQEELVFHRVIERLADLYDAAGHGRARQLLGLLQPVVLSSPPRRAGDRDGTRSRRTSRREAGNFALNGLSEAATFVHGALGAEPGDPLEFTAESTGAPVSVVQHDLRSLMELAGLDRVDLLLADVQGAEEVLLARAGGDLAAGRVRFLIVSTHHHSISGDPLTHQRALSRLTEAGAHVIAEHSVPESFSGDGLIAVSFDERDRDLLVAVSHARARDSLFGELEVDLEVEHRRADAAEQRAAAAEQRLAVVERGAAAPTDGASGARQELAAIEQTRIWRWSRSARAMVARIRAAPVAAFGRHDPRRPHVPGQFRSNTRLYDSSVPGAHRSDRRAAVRYFSVRYVHDRAQVPDPLRGPPDLAVRHRLPHPSPARPSGRLAGPGAGALPRHGGRPAGRVVLARGRRSRAAGARGRGDDRRRHRSRRNGDP